MSLVSVTSGKPLKPFLAGHAQRQWPAAPRRRAAHTDCRRRLGAYVFTFPLLRAFKLRDERYISPGSEQPRPGPRILDALSNPPVKFQRPKVPTFLTSEKVPLAAALLLVLADWYSGGTGVASREVITVAMLALLQYDFIPSGTPILFFHLLPPLEPS